MLSRSYLLRGVSLVRQIRSDGFSAMNKPSRGRHLFSSFAPYAPFSFPLVLSVGHNTSFSRCDAAVAVPPTVQKSHIGVRTKAPSSSWRAIKEKAVRVLKIFARLVKLAVILAPIVLLAPFRMINQKSQHIDAMGYALADMDQREKENWYLRLCLRCVEWSGAAVIKLMQWAGSRPDMFGHDFCAVFSGLQDNTTPHHWKHTERALRDTYGDNWRDRIQVNELIGSGCVGQVYRGTVKDQEGNNHEVAIKVMHPHIRDDIDTDLDIMRVVARLLPVIYPQMSWLNPEGGVEEFASVLTKQLDLRRESRNLEIFNKNFEGDDEVFFPKLIPGFEASRDVLIETYCDGVPIMEFAKQNRHNQQVLTQLCNTAIKCVCKMIFLDNFVHGDLHPGNVFVTKDRKVVLLDFGIVVEYTEVDHRHITDVLTAFIHHQGERAARLLIDNSRVRLGDDSTVDDDGFVQKIAEMARKASGEDYLMEHLGTYISQICQAAADHHVMMNQSFVSGALAIKVQEGIALALDPSIEIWTVANPIILEGEARRRAKSLGNKIQESLSWKDSAKRIFGLARESVGRRSTGQNPTN